MSKVCAVTGHRPNRFECKYNEGHTLCKAIKKAILNEFKQMYDEQEVRHIYVGGALGVDMWAGEAALQLKETPGYSGLQMHIVLPFEGHDLKWNQQCRERQASLIRHSDECVTVGCQPIPGPQGQQRSGTERVASPGNGAVQGVWGAIPTSKNCGFRQRREPQFRVFVETKTLLVQ